MAPDTSLIVTETLRLHFLSPEQAAEVLHFACLAARPSARHARLLTLRMKDYPVFMPMVKRQWTADDLLGRGIHPDGVKRNVQAPRD